MDLPQVRAHQWCTYCASTLPYPATIALPTVQIVSTLMDNLRSLFPCGTWAKSTLICDIGMALGIRGGPRDLLLVAEVSALAAAARHAHGGPRTQQDAAKRLDTYCEQWARHTEDQAVNHSLPNGVHLRAAEKSNKKSGQGPPEQPRGGRTRRAQGHGHCVVQEPMARASRRPLHHAPSAPIRTQAMGQN